MASTIYDVARYAGVSIATVSRVINQKDRISPQTKARVLEAIEALDFIANVNASGLAKSRTGIIGVLLYGFDDAGISESYTVELLSGIQQQLQEVENSLLIINSVEECQRLIRNKRMDGLIVHGYCKMCETQQMEWPVGFPVVYAGEMFSTSTLDVCYSFERYVAAGIEKLVEKGHTEICSVFYAESPFELESKINIFEKIYKDHQLNFSTDRSLVNGAFDKDNVYKTIADKISSGATACLTDSVYFAQQVIDATTRLGVRIPAQVSVISMEYEKDAAGWLHPEIDSLNVPSFELGRRSTELLLGKIEGKPQPAGVSVFEPQYTDRGSIRKLAP